MLSRSAIVAQIAAIPAGEVERNMALRSLVRGLGELILADEKSDREWAREWVSDNRHALRVLVANGKSVPDAVYDRLWANQDDYDDELFDLVVAEAEKTLADSWNPSLV